MSNSSSRRLSKLSKVTQQMNNFPTPPPPCYCIQKNKFKEPDKCRDPIADSWMGLDQEKGSI